MKLEAKLETTAPLAVMDLNPAKQARSHKSLDQILAATRDLLYEKEFNLITVAEIVQRSGTSAGAFYLRFPSKEAVLPALYDAYSRNLPNESAVWSDPATWGVRSLAVRVAQMVRFVVRDYRATRPFMRPLALYCRQRAQEISAESRHFSRDKHQAACAFLLDCRDEITHPHPELAVDLIAYFVPAIGRDKILFGDAPHASSIEIEDSKLEEELIRLALSYLQGGPIPSM